MTRPAPPPRPTGISIGALSNATGIGVETIRTWGRRYGFPSPIARTEGSHRRYAPEAIETLRLVAQGIALGLRASQLLGSDNAQLQQLLDAARPPQLPSGTKERAISALLQSLDAMDSSAFHRNLTRAQSLLPVPEFLDTVLGPFLTQVGNQWQQGHLRIGHEHFATQCTEQFLAAQWRPLVSGNRRGTAACYVLATLPGERHCLGLHMAAWVVALTGAHMVFLGADTPIAEVVFASEQCNARAIVLSISASCCRQAPEQLAALKRQLPPDRQVVVGGAGAPTKTSSLRTMNSFSALSDWTSFPI